MVLEDVTEESLPFLVPMGTLRAALRAAKQQVELKEQEHADATELKSVAAREQAKVEAKEKTKESTKDNKRGGVQKSVEWRRSWLRGRLLMVCLEKKARYASPLPTLPCPR